MRKRLWYSLVTTALIGLAFDAAPALATGDDGAEAAASLSPVPDAWPPRYGPEPLFVVTFIKSRITDPIRTATVVSVTNQTATTCYASVTWFRGIDPTPVCTTTFALDAGLQTDFCSRAIPDALTTCNATCAPDLTFHEGKAVVSKGVSNPLVIHDVCDNLAVSARVYYTLGETDTALTAISDSKIMRVNQGNVGD